MTRTIQILRSVLIRPTLIEAPLPPNNRAPDVRLTREELATLFARELGYGIHP